MGIIGTIISMFTGKPLRPKDAAAYQRAIGLRPEDVAAPHPAGCKRKPSTNEAIVSRPPGKRRWKYLNVCGDVVRANTKSEARAAFKRLLRLDHLPPGAVVSEVVKLK